MSEIHIQIGEILKNARIKKNISLEKVSFKTKISIQNLNNIENGKIHLFAGVFYYKSFKTWTPSLEAKEYMAGKSTE